ncbi:MAG: PQQ-dependent sugar dehydrogenase, partial [Burkholderiaceae bacterium]
MQRLQNRRRLLQGFSGAGALALLPAFARPTQAQTTPALPSPSKDLAREVGQKGFVVRTLVTGLNQPWSMAWLPTGELLVTERDGQLRRISRDFT